MHLRSGLRRPEYVSNGSMRAPHCKGSPVMRISYVLYAALSMLLLSTAGNAATAVTLVAKGKAKCMVIVDAKAAAEAQKRRRPDQQSPLLYRAAEDLVTYLGKMSGAEVPMAVRPREGLLPIYVGSFPEPMTLSHSTEFADAYLLDVTPDRIVLGGESNRAVYYATARLLHQLGVRWYAPTELGEHVPRRKTLIVNAGQTESAPDYRTRHVWHQKAEHWALRNRLGGPVQAQGHAFARFLNYGRNFKEHPDWYPLVEGRPVQHNANLSNPQVLQLFVDKVRTQFEAGAKWVCVGPDDAVFLDERPRSRAMDSGRIDPLLDIRSSTDKLVRFANAIAEQLEDEFGERKLTFYVYSNHQIPPATVKPHPMILPIIAPINYTRYSSLGNPVSRTSMLLEQHIRAWAQQCGGFGFYLYDFNLADTAMPYTRTLYYRKSIPKLRAMGATDATVQTCVNWHTMVPGAWVLSHLLWDVDTDVNALLAEFYPDYYGAAADTMRQYDHIIEQAYESSSAYAGNLWSMHRILTKDVRNRLDSLLTTAQEQVKDDALRAQRLEVRRFGLNYAKHYFAARDALNRFGLAAAAKAHEAYQANYEQAHEKYPVFFDPLNLRYWDTFHGRSYADAGRVAGEGTVVYRLPDEMPAFLDDHEIGQHMGLSLPACDTNAWTRLRTYSASIDEQGLGLFRGVIWYRHDFDLPAEARGAKRLILWMGGLDGPTQVYLNGQDLGRLRVSNFNPGEIDITQAVDRTGTNTLVIACDNSVVNELGTGGLMRPALIYAADAAPAQTQPTKGEQ